MRIQCLLEDVNAMSNMSNMVFSVWHGSFFRENSLSRMTFLSFSEVDFVCFGLQRSILENMILMFILAALYKNEI